jgi:hypothetical protein
MSELQSALAALIQANPSILKAAKGGQKAKTKGGRKPLSDEERAAYAAKNDAECVKVFTKAGFKDVQPRVNVLTYGKVKPDGSKTGWIGKGRMVKKGEKSHRVGPFNLFHESQTELMGKAAA